MLVRGWIVGRERIEAERYVYRPWNGRGRNCGDSQIMKSYLDRTALCLMARVPFGKKELGYLDLMN